jgi:hypothetical protein
MKLLCNLEGKAMNKKIEEQLTDLIIKLKSNQAKIEKLEDDNNFIKKRIMFLLDKAKSKNFSYYNPELFDHELKCSLCERKDIRYDIARAKELLGKKKCKQFIDSSYEVCDIEKLKDLAKNHGISPQELKDCLSVNEKVNNKKLDNLYDLGEIDFEEVEKFAEVKLTSRYISIR